MLIRLNYHRRHGWNCEGKHPSDTYTSESEERKKAWAKCHCPIYASGSLSRKARRVATKLTDWQAAAALMAPYLAANSWDLPTSPFPPPVGPSPASLKSEMSRSV